MADSLLKPMPNPSLVTPSPAWPHLTLRRGVLILLLVGLAAVLLLSLSMGSVAIPVEDILKVLTGNEPQKAVWTTIVRDFRLPKALTAILAGAALAVAGLEMQTIFRNPLADPFVLGINSGASLGVALVVLSAGLASASSAAALLAGAGLLQDAGLVVAASIGAAVVMGLVLLVSRRVEGTTTLLILGLMIGYATSAVVSLLLYFSIAERIQAYVSWTFGSFGGVTWGQMRIFGPVNLIALGLAFVLAKPLNALLLGEGYARSMGLNVRRARIGIIASASILAGTVTAFCGPIGFLGIAVPHLCRMLLNTSDHRMLIPATAILGAIVAVLADLIATLPGSQTVLPLNAVTALLGAPVVVWVILRQRRISSSFAQ
jgi:iron complex transport system permease protein